MSLFGSVATCGSYDNSDAQLFPLLLIVAVVGGGDGVGVDVADVVIVVVALRVLSAA